MENQFMKIAITLRRVLFSLFAVASLATLLYTIGAPGEFAP